MKNISAYLSIAFSMLAVAGCGGGGDGGTAPVAAAPAAAPAPSTAPPPAAAPASAPPPAPTESAEGLYAGTTSNGRAITGIVLDEGTHHLYYVLYSIVGNPNAIGGVVQGTGSATNGSLTSSDARDFNLEGLGVLPATLSSTYTQQQTLSGLVAYGPGSTVSFSGSYVSTAQTAAPSLTTLAGAFSGQVASSAGLENAVVNVSTSGALSGAGSSGCTVAGTVTPRQKGLAYYMSLRFGGPPCLFANQTLAGIVYFDASNRRLYAAAPNGNRTDGVLFVGTKP